MVVLQSEDAMAETNPPQKVITRSVDELLDEFLDTGPAPSAGQRYGGVAEPITYLDEFIDPQPPAD